MIFGTVGGNQRRGCASIVFLHLDRFNLLGFLYDGHTYLTPAIKLALYPFSCRQAGDAGEKMETMATVLPSCGNMHVA